MRITVLQWNVWYKEDIDKITALIKKYQPDVVCAQELIQHFQPTPQLDTAKEIAAKLGFNYYFHFADKWTQRAEKETQGNAIFTKLQIIKTNHHFLQSPKTDPANASEEGRVLVEVTVNKEGKELTFGTTHLSYSPFFEMTADRQQEALKLVDFLENKKEKYVFTGDLNAFPESFLLEKLADLKQFRHAGPDFSEKTWTTKPFDKQGFVETDLNWRLDYVFATKDLTVTKAEVIDTQVSDHLPVLVELEV